MFDPWKLAGIVMLAPKPALKTEFAKPLPFTLEHLTGWIAGMPAANAYIYESSHDCPFGLYGAKFCDRDDLMDAETPFQAAYQNFSDRYGDDNATRMVYAIAMLRPHSFGAALERARALVIVT